MSKYYVVISHDVLRKRLALPAGMVRVASVSQQPDSFDHIRIDLDIDDGCDNGEAERASIIWNGVLNEFDLQGLYKHVEVLPGTPHEEVLRIYGKEK